MRRGVRSPWSCAAARSSLSACSRWRAATPRPASRINAEKPDPLHSYEGRVIRGWLLSLERQDYSQAAYYFAPNALIDQGRPYRLRTESEALAFNASLPCRADLVRLKGEGRAPRARDLLAAGRAPAARAAAP